MTTFSEFGNTNKAEQLTTTEISEMINSSVPTKMFKGDDHNFMNNFTTDENIITTISPTQIDSVTITEPSIKMYYEYTTENELISSTDAENRNGNIPKTDLDTSDLTTSTISSKVSEDLSNVNGENEIATSKIEHVTLEDDFQITSIPNLINNNDSVENSTQFPDHKTIEITTLFDSNSKVIPFNDSSESTLISTTINSQTSTTKTTVDEQDLNTEKPTQLQNSFEIFTLTPIENNTKYFNDNVLSTTRISNKDASLSKVSESVTLPQHTQATTFPETTTNIETTFVSTEKINDAVASTDNEGLLKYDVGTSTKNVIMSYDSTTLTETTTLKNMKTDKTVDGNDNKLNTTASSTIFDSDNSPTSTKQILLFDPNEPTESSTEPISSKMFEETTRYDTTSSISEITSKDFELSTTVQSMNKDPVTTTENELNDPMNSRTIYFDEENELKVNEFTTTQSYSEINFRNNQNKTENNPTEQFNLKTTETTPVYAKPTDRVEVENASPSLVNTTFNELSSPESTTDERKHTSSVTTESSETSSTVRYNENSSYADITSDSEGIREPTLKNTIKTTDVFTAKTTEYVDSKYDFERTTTTPTYFTNAVEEHQTDTFRPVDDQTLSTAVSKTTDDIGTTASTSSDYDDVKTTGANSEITTSNNEVNEKPTETVVVSDRWTGDAAATPSTTTAARGAEAIAVTAPNRVTGDYVNRPFSSAAPGYAVTAVAESTAKNVETSAASGAQTAIDDSKVSQNLRKNWETLLGIGGGSSATDGPSADAVVPKEISAEDHGVTNGFANGADDGSTEPYDLTTTTVAAGARGKNESAVTSNRVAGGDDTISAANETNTMAANEVTAGSDFETEDGPNVSTRVYGDGPDATEGPGRSTDEFTTHDSVGFPETTTVAVLTMADWIKTKSTAPKETPDGVVTEEYVENRTDSPTETNTPETDGLVTTTGVTFEESKTNDADRMETSSAGSLEDAATMVNFLTTSIEVLVSSLSTENPETTDAVTTQTSTEQTANPNKSHSGVNSPANEIVSTTMEGDTSTSDFDDNTERFTVVPTEETTFESRTDAPVDTDPKNKLIFLDTERDTTDSNSMLTTTEYTVTSKTIEIEDVTLKNANYDHINTINSYSLQQITTETRKRCRNDTDCDAGHKCSAAKCLPTGESRVNNCPPGIITLQCLKGIIYS